MSTAEIPDIEVQFCGYCAQVPDRLRTAGPGARLCTCDYGLLLRASSRDAPAPGAAFLVVEPPLTVAGTSRGAERLLNTREARAVGDPLTRLLLPADGASPDELEAEIRRVVDGDEQVQRHFRPIGALELKLHARIGPCRSPRAALVVLDPD